MPQAVLISRTAMAKTQQSVISGVFHRPFDQQVAFFRNKLGNLVPTARWDDLKHSQHDTGFMVAGAARADLLSDLAAAVDRAIAEGKSLHAFRQDFNDVVQRRGWHGWTGEGSAKGRAWRTRIIYQTNANTAYAAGRMAQLQEGGYSLWVYKHSESAKNPRPQHLAWNGLALPPEHPFWKTHYPPNGWGCGCYVVGARNEQGVRRLGGDPDKQPTAADLTTEGINKGWDYAPGASVADTVQQMAEKTRQWDYTLAKAYMQELPASVRDRFATSYRALPSVADDARRYARRMLESLQGVDRPETKTLGLLTADDVARLATAGLTLDAGFDWAMDRSSVLHIFKRHGSDDVERLQGRRGVTADDYAHLPQILNTYGHDGQLEISTNETGTGHSAVVITSRVDGQRVQTVWELRKKNRRLTLKTMMIWKSQ